MKQDIKYFLLAWKDQNMEEYARFFGTKPINDLSDDEYANLTKLVLERVFPEYVILDKEAHEEAERNREDTMWFEHPNPRLYKALRECLLSDKNKFEQFLVPMFERRGMKIALISDSLSNIATFRISKRDNGRDKIVGLYIFSHLMMQES